MDEELNHEMKTGCTSPHEVLPEILAKNMKEVNENPETLEEDIKAFRNLILEDTELHAKLDDEFLLRFLRARKFDKQRALTLIQDYYKIRYKLRNLFQYAKPSLLRNIFESNIETILPQRDNLGRRIGIFRMANWNPDEIKSDVLTLSLTLIFEKISQEKETQLCGFCGIIDCKGLTFYQARHMSVLDIKNSVTMNMNSFPQRFKAVHVLNEGPLMRQLLKIMKMFLTKKLRDRIYIHGEDYSSLHQHIPAAILPKEYGGDQPSIDSRPFFESLFDSEEYFENLMTFGYGKISDNKPDKI